MINTMSQTMCYGPCQLARKMDIDPEWVSRVESYFCVLLQFELRVGL